MERFSINMARWTAESKFTEYRHYAKVELGTISETEARQRFVDFKGCFEMPEFRLALHGWTETGRKVE